MSSNAWMGPLLAWSLLTRGGGWGQAAHALPKLFPSTISLGPCPFMWEDLFLHLLYLTLWGPMPSRILRLVPGIPKFSDHSTAWRPELSANSRRRCRRGGCPSRPGPCWAGAPPRARWRARPTSCASATCSSFSSRTPSSRRSRGQSGRRCQRPPRAPRPSSAGWRHTSRATTGPRTPIASRSRARRRSRCGAASSSRPSSASGARRQHLRGRRAAPPPPMRQSVACPRAPPASARRPLPASARRLPAR